MIINVGGVIVLSALLTESLSKSNNCILSVDSLVGLDIYGRDAKSALALLATDPEILYTRGENSSLGGRCKERNVTNMAGGPCIISNANCKKTEAAIYVL